MRRLLASVCLAGIFLVFGASDRAAAAPPSSTPFSASGIILFPCDDLVVSYDVSGTNTGFGLNHHRQIATGTATDFSTGETYTVRTTADGFIELGLQQKIRITFVLVGDSRTLTLTAVSMFNATSGEQTVNFSFQQTTCSGTGVVRMTFTQ